MERIPNTQDVQESSPTTPKERIEASAQSLENEVGALAALEPKGEISDATVERVQKKASFLKNFIRVASIGAALVGANEVRSYASSRYEISTVTREDGSTTYEHEDPETNRIMSYLTGEKPLAQEDRIFFYRQVVREAYREHQRFLAASKGDTADVGIDALNAYETDIPTDEQGLKKKLAQIYAYEDAVLGDFGSNGTAEDRVEKTFAEAIKAPIKYDPTFAKILWSIQEKVGAPRIRWAAPGENTHSNITSRLVGAGRANYQHSDNTVYLQPGAVGETLVAEDAHAYQFNHKPIQSRAQFLIDTGRTVAASIRNGTKMYEEQKKQYSTPGSIEYEAHEVIEAKIIKEAEEEERALRKK